jgi:BMFP domain-containing protein YqiC
MKTYSLTQVRKMLHVDNKTLASWLERAGIELQKSEHDQRVKRITEEQLRMLADTHERQIGALPTEKEVHPTVKALERKVSDLAGRLDYLETHDPSADLSRLFGLIEDLREHLGKLQERISEMEAQLHDMRVVFLSDVWRTAPDELKALTSRIEALESRLITPSKRPASPRPQPARSVEPTAESSELPEGLVGAVTFAQQHGISPSAIKKAIAVGRLPVTRGRWKQGRAWIQDAWDAQGRRAFVEEYCTNPNYHRCQDPECVCQEYETAGTADASLQPSPLEPIEASWEEEDQGE